MVNNPGVGIGGGVALDSHDILSGILAPWTFRDPKASEPPSQARSRSFQLKVVARASPGATNGGALPTCSWFVFLEELGELGNFVAFFSWDSVFFFGN